MAGREAWDPARPGAAAGVGESVYSETLGSAICERVAAGESMSAVCRTAGMPERSTLRNWMRAHPEFGEALRSAMRAARLRQRAADQAALALMAQARAGERRGRPSTYRLEVAEAICERLANGETMTSIGRDPAMPCFGTALAWVRRHPEFAEMYAQARQAYADYMCDEARDVAAASTHETVWSDRLQFDSIRWAAARVAPKKYCERLVVEAEVSARRADAAQAAGEAKAASNRLVIHAIDFHRGPNGKVLAAPPRNEKEEAAWVEAYGRPYDGPR